MNVENIIFIINKKLLKSINARFEEYVKSLQHMGKQLSMK